MKNCSECGRHLVQNEAQCPFCGTGQQDGLLERAVKVCVAGATTVVLAACYGPAPGGWDTAQVIQDFDEDGFFEDDCDDADPAIHPEAKEICDDDVDNDCDMLVDDIDPDCDKAKK